MIARLPLLILCAVIPWFTIGAAPKVTPDSTILNRRKLDQIIIPKLEFREATVREVIDFLKKKCIEYDPSPPGMRGVNIVLELDNAPLGPGVIPGLSDRPPEPRFTLSRTKISLGEALRTIADLAGLQLRIEAYRVYIVPKHD